LGKNVIGGGPKLRHDPDATCQGLFELWSEFSADLSVRRRVDAR
jgi:hypothetical protein